MININSKVFIAGHNGMLGSSILRELKKKGYKKLITIGESIKEVGSHQIVIRPHQDVEFTISLDVIAEGD